MRREQLITNVLWRALSWDGMEYCAVWRAPDGYQIDGTCLAVCDDRPLRVRYAVQCTPSWETSAVFIETRLGREQHVLKMTVTPDLQWLVGETELEKLHGCVDVDLGISPCTNALPIRRMAAVVGETRATRAAWVRFPELEVQPAEQRYTRVSEREYLYESATARRTIVVDEHGFPVSYERGWTRIVASPQGE